MIKNVTGKSCTNGIEFSTLNYCIGFETNSDETMFFLRKKLHKVSKILDFMFTIPFLRGLAALFMYFKLELLVLLLDFISNITSIGSKTVISVSPIFITIFTGVLFIILLLCSIKKVMKFRQYHGAEHKILYISDHGEDVNLDNCRNAPRISDNCGTMLVVLFIFTFIVTNYIFSSLGINHWLCLRLIIAFIGAYELFLLDRNVPIISLIFKLGYWFQQYLFTAEPSDFQLKQAIEAFKFLEKLENEEITFKELKELLELPFDNQTFL